MKILHIGPIKNSNTQNASDAYEIIPNLGEGGPARSILGLAVGLSHRGVQSGVLSTKPFTAPPPNSLTQNVQFLTSYAGHKYNPWIQGEKWMGQIEREFGKPDLINFHDVYDLFSCGLAAALKKNKWPYIITPRGGLRPVAQNRDRPKKVVANALFFRRYLRNALFIHALAENEAHDIEKFDSKLKTRISPNGLPREFLTHLDSLPSIPPDPVKIRIGFIGHLYVKIKGIDLLLDAVARLQQEQKAESLSFVFVGAISKPEDQSAIDACLQKMPHPEKIEFTGSKYGLEKWQALNSFDVFVLPSRTEGMPVVALEAMALRKPCLFSEGSNMSQIITHCAGGWNGGNTSTSLYEALKEILSTSKAKLIEKGLNARKCFEENYTWDRVAEAYLRMLPESLGRST